MRIRGVRREVLRGDSPNPAGGLGGGGALVSPPSGVRGRAPEDFEINAFQRLRTPVSLSFLSQCCYTKIHAIFFIHSHPHHFQLNEVVPRPITRFDTKKSNVKDLPSFEVLFFTCTIRACWCSEFWKQFLTVIQGQKKLLTVIIHMHSLPVRR